MSDLRLETITLPSADFGPENPLPELAGHANVSSQFVVDEGVPPEDVVHRGYGCDFGTLPHRMQDGYDRCKKPRQFRVAVLENEHLKATFLLELGGKLWSLIDKSTGCPRELLDANPVVQPANLALRSAWCSGGAEWNVGLIAHSAFTCSSVFAARLALADGTPVLRLYEWERTRLAPFQIDAFLPAGARVLLIRGRIINPGNETIPMSWWSNIAVPETDGGRVLAPAVVADRHTYSRGLARCTLPSWDGIDGTFPTNHKLAGDLYYRIPKGQYPWMAAIDAKGWGLVHASTSRLAGRKLWYWGRGKGGHRWQEFLALPGRRYIEIQGGLAPTQGESVPMPAGADWSWLEAYGAVQTEPAKSLGADWAAAWKHVEGRLTPMISQAGLEKVYKDTAAMADMPPQEIIHQGSGWAALENHRRQRGGVKLMSPASTPYPDSTMGPDQRPWLELLETGTFPHQPVDQVPGSFMVQAEWRQMLEASLARDGGGHWLSWFHAGVMCYVADDKAGAKAAWEKSLGYQRSAWALRNLAVLARQDNRHEEAADLLSAAVKMIPDLRSLIVECADALLAADRPVEAARLLDGTAAEIRRHGRVRFLRARAALALGQMGEVEEYFRGQPEVPDMREGEVTLTELWFNLQEQLLAGREKRPVDEALKKRVRQERPAPQWIDFRVFLSAEFSG